MLNYFFKLNFNPEGEIIENKDINLFKGAKISAYPEYINLHYQKYPVIKFDF